MGESAILISQHDSGWVPFILEGILGAALWWKFCQGPYLESPGWKQGGTVPCSLLAFPWGAEGCVSVKWPSTWKHYHHFVCYLSLSLGTFRTRESCTIWEPHCVASRICFLVSMYGFTCLRMRLGGPVPHPVVPVGLAFYFKVLLEEVLLVFFLAYNGSLGSGESLHNLLTSEGGIYCLLLKFSTRMPYTWLNWFLIFYKTLSTTPVL